jgi:hypothetical protein
LGWSGMSNIPGKHTVRLAKGVLEQCSHVVHLWTDEGVKAPVLQAISECRSHNGLRSLRALHFDFGDPVAFHQDSSV